VCCRVLQCVAVCCIVTEVGPLRTSVSIKGGHCLMCMCVAECFNMLQSVAVCCSVWQCVELGPL